MPVLLSTINSIKKFEICYGFMVLSTDLSTLCVDKMVFGTNYFEDVNMMGGRW